MVRSIMVEKLVNTMPFESASIPPSLTTVEYTPDLMESTPTPPLPFLSMDTCIILWSAKSKLFLQFDMHHFYEIKRVFFIMARKQTEELLTHKQFWTMWECSVKLKVENLFTMILAWKHLRLSDPFVVFAKIGDVGARIYLDYFGCEK